MIDYWIFQLLYQFIWLWNNNKLIIDNYITISILPNYLFIKLVDRSLELIHNEN